MADRRGDLARLINLSASAPAGRLVLATSCSWRRILTERGNAFLVPTVGPDGHRDLDTTQAAEFVTELVNWFRDNCYALCVEASNNANDSATLTALIAELRKREAVGRAKYGTDVDRTDLTAHQWRQHLREELMDALLYSLCEERSHG